MDALQLAERHLRAERDYNASNSILPSENRVIDRLLSDNLEMADVWTEMAKTSRSEDVFLAAIRRIVSLAAFYHPEKTKSSRELLNDAKAQVLGTTKKGKQVSGIKKKAKELATLLNQHIAFTSRESIETGIREHIAEHFDLWASVSRTESSYLYDNHLREHIEALRYSYDSKYWPTLADCLNALAAMCDEPIRISDQITACATSTSRQASPVDFVRNIERIMQEHSIQLGDKSMTSLMNCALGLVDDAVNLKWMNTTRKRVKEAGDN